MTTPTDLSTRIEAEFGAYEQSLAKLRETQLADYQGRRERLALFDPLCERLRKIWGPRLETLARRFDEHVEVTPFSRPAAARRSSPSTPNSRTSSCASSSRPIRTCASSCSATTCTSSRS